MWLRVWLKKYFKLAMFLFIALSVTIIVISKIKNPDLAGEKLVQVNQLLDAEQSVIKSYVWNPDNRLSIGVIKEQLEPAYARELCRKIEALQVYGVSISVVDVLKLQSSGGEDWDEIGFVECRRK